MLIPYDLPRYSFIPSHPYHVPNVDRAKIVVTLNGVPQESVWEWSVPDRYIKRRLKLHELEKRHKANPKMNNNAVSRFKGEVAVFIET